MEEGQFVDGKWRRGRRLNGDEVTILTVEAPKLFRLKYILMEIIDEVEEIRREKAEKRDEFKKRILLTEVIAE